MVDFTVAENVDIIPRSSDNYDRKAVDMTDSLGSLGVFVRVAETRSFTLAGRQLGVSSSAVGKAVARLEDRLGVRLLHRSTRAVSLTAEGAMFLDRCRRILAEVEAAEQELAQTRAAPRGRLRVSLPLVGTLMTPAICGFMRAYPEIELDIDFSDRLVDVVDEGFDAVIRAGDLDDSRLMSRMLGTFRLLLVAAPDYLRRCGMPCEPADLLRHACLHHRYATSGTLEPWPLRDGPRSSDLPVTAAVNTIDPLIVMAERGLGIACLPDLAIRPQLAEGTLVAVLEDRVEHAGPFRLLWPSSRYVSPKLRVFVDYMAENLFKDAG